MSHFPLQHVTEYAYSGLNWRINWHYDTDNDQDVDANDKGRSFVYDKRWQPVAPFREDNPRNCDPKEQFVYHAAGNDGRGTASYIDDVILRDRDANTDWDVQADGTLEERFYYCQNWRHDVVALLDANGAGQQVEQVRYEAYGMPYVVVAGDVNVSGKIDSADTTQIQDWIDMATYNVLGDVDLDGDVDATDKSIVSSDPAGGGDRGELTHGVHANRKGYAGYEFDDTIWHESYHVRHRVLNSELGQWNRRDPVGYDDGIDLYSYAKLNPVSRFDPSGQLSMPECRSAVNWCKLYDPVASAMLIRLRGMGCTPTIGCTNQVTTACGRRGVGGYFDCSASTINICAIRASSQQSVCRILSHELQHAIDACSRDDCNLDCETRACDEVRAYARSGQCCPGQGWLRPNETFAQCVKRLAIWSTTFDPSCVATDLTDNWCRCFLVPGNIPPCQSL